MRVTLYHHCVSGKTCIAYPQEHVFGEQVNVTAWMKTLRFYNNLYRIVSIGNLDQNKQQFFHLVFLHVVPISKHFLGLSALHVRYPIVSEVLIRTHPNYQAMQIDLFFYYSELSLLIVSANHIRTEYYRQCLFISVGRFKRKFSGAAPFTLCWEGIFSASRAKIDARGLFHEKRESKLYLEPKSTSTFSFIPEWTSYPFWRTPQWLHMIISLSWTISYLLIKNNASFSRNGKETFLLF